MAEFGVGAPVGKSFEVPGADLEAATANAWRAAEAVGFDYGRSLYSEQIAAGVWEIVLSEAVPAEVKADVDAGYEAVAARVRRDRLLRFFDFLSDSTDLFDPVMVKMVLESKGSLRLSPDMRAELVDQFLATDVDPGR